MARFLPAGILLLTAATTAHAQQQPDSAPAVVPDSLDTRSLSTGCPTIWEIKYPSRPLTTIQPMLSRVAGVQVTPYSGAPGAWSTVRIRGVANVTGNSQPLYIVDGVPVYNLDAKPEDWTGIYGFFRGPQGGGAVGAPFSPVGNPLLDMPAEDVAQIEVMQGAAATAQYGGQGTNGVIRISTRRGADGNATAQPLRVRYAGWAGVQHVRQRYELLNTRQYAELANVAAVNNGSPPTYSATELGTLQGTDWQDKALRVAGIQSHNLSLDGLTSHHTRYYVAADYLRQTGVLMNSRLSRYSVRANAEQQLGNKLRVGLEAGVSQLDQRQPSPESDVGSTLANLLLAAPIAPPTTPDPYRFDPLRSLRQQYHEPRTRRLLAQLHADYQLSPALALRAYASHERVALADDFYQAPIEYSAGTRTEFEQTATATVKSWVTGAEMRYQRTWAARHAVSGSVHYLRQQFERAQQQEQRSFRNPAPGQPLELSSRIYYEQSLKSEPIHSTTAAGSYTYAGRYEVQASMRSELVRKHDGQEAQYRWFPGGQVRWHVGQEAFLGAAAGLSSLTLQAGAGRTRSYFSNDQTTHYDAGLHLGVLRNQLTLDAAVYRRRTKRPEALLPVTFPTTPGYGTIYLYPDPELLNRGLTLTLSGTWQAGELRGQSTVAVATNHNEVAKLRDSGSYPFFNYQRLENGKSVSSFGAYEQDGTYPAGSAQAGQVRLRDLNGDGQLDARDMRADYTGLPRYTLNVYQQFTLKRWQLEAQVDGLFGYHILNSTLLALDRPTGINNVTERVLNYWTPTNQDTPIPRPGRTAYSYPLTNQGLESGNHVRLSQLQVSYEVLNTGTRKASVWLGGQNLLVTGPYRGFDPNVSSGGAAPLLAGQDASVYPVARVWQVGVRGQF